MASSQPYDPYIPQDSTTSNLRNESNYSNSGNDTTAALKAKIDDTVDIMRENINKVVERGERLDSIEDRADNLATSAQGFKRGANRVRKQMWWKDTKWTICLIIAVIILLIVIIVPIVIHFT